MRSRGALIVLLAAASASCVAEEAPGEKLRVLFVGNSLTYYNDLPAMVVALNGAVEGAKPVQADMLATGGASIRDHLAGGALARTLAETDFDVVVLQDIGGWPLCPPGDAACAQSVPSVRAAVDLARAAGTRPIWYATWQIIPERQQALSAQVADRAAQMEVDVADVGAALAAYGCPGDPLLHEDGHPDELGSWVAAATILRVLVGSELPERLALDAVCRTPWQDTRLSARALATEQASPAADCSVPAPGQLQAALRAANSVVDGKAYERGKE